MNFLLNEIALEYLAERSVRIQHSHPQKLNTVQKSKIRKKFEENIYQLISIDVNAIPLLSEITSKLCLQSRVDRFPLSVQSVQ